MLLALAPATAWADGLAGLDLDEPSGTSGDRTRIAIGFQWGHSDERGDSEGNPNPNLQTDTRTLLLSVDHRFAD
ncbi:MAG: hypothetical protein ACREO3_10650, partial [Arenimonas sp.]